MTALPDLPNDAAAGYSRFEGSRLSRFHVSVCSVSVLFLSVSWPTSYRASCTLFLCLLLRYFLLLWRNSMAQKTTLGGSQDRAEAEAMEERCLLTCSDFIFIQPWIICLSRDGTVPSGLGSPASIINQEKPHRLSSGLSWWGHFLNWGSSSQMTLGCVKYKTNSLTITPILEPTLQRGIGQKSITSL